MLAGGTSTKKYSSDSLSIRAKRRPLSSLEPDMELHEFYERDSKAPVNVSRRGGDLERHELDAFTRSTFPT